MFRYFIYFSYDGAAYHGWQVQPNGITVQEILQTEDTWSAMWMKFGQRKHPYDDNFKSVLEYTQKNQITKTIAYSLKTILKFQTSILNC